MVASTIYYVIIGLVFTGIAIQDFRTRRIRRVIWYPLYGIGAIRTLYITPGLLVVGLSVTIGAIMYVNGDGLADLLGMIAGLLLVPRLWLLTLFLTSIIGIGTAAWFYYKNGSTDQPFFVPLAMGYWLALLVSQMRITALVPI